MISNLKELEKVRDKYCRADCQRTRAYREEAEMIAIDNFWWVLQAAISATEAVDRRPK